MQHVSVYVLTLIGLIIPSIILHSILTIISLSPPHRSYHTAAVALTCRSPYFSDFTQYFPQKWAREPSAPIFRNLNRIISSQGCWWEGGEVVCHAVVGPSRGKILFSDTLAPRNKSPITYSQTKL